MFDIPLLDLPKPLCARDVEEFADRYATRAICEGNAETSEAGHLELQIVIRDILR